MGRLSEDPHSQKMCSMRIGRSHFLFCTLTLLLMSVIPARADLEAGKRAYEQGDYATALKEVRPLAEQGNAGIQKANFTSGPCI